MNSNVKTAVLWFVIICVAVLLWAVVHTGRAKVDDQPTFTQLMDYVEKGRVKTIVVNSSTGDVQGIYNDTDGRPFHSNIPLHGAFPRRRFHQ